MEQQLETIVSWFQSIDFASQSPLVFIALGMSGLALLFALLAWLRAGKNKQPGSAQLISRKMQDQNLRLNDLDGRWNTKHTELVERTQSVEERLRALEGKGGSGAQKYAPPAPAVEVAEEEPVSARDELEKMFEVPPPAPTVEGRALAEGDGVHGGLEKTRKHFFSRLRDLFSRKGELGDDLFEELEELLVSSDLGVKTSQELIARLQQHGAATEEECRDELKRYVREVLEDERAVEIAPNRVGDAPLVIVMIGVNGVGKTTTIAKLAAQFKDRGAKVLLGACDTFRAAATEQLETWAERIGVEIVTGPDGAKPSTVAYETIHRAADGGHDVVIIDTAGRLHTRTNLMKELENVMRIVSREQPGAPHETLLVIDATTGQNGLQQAREFNKAATLSGIVVTKLDGTPKGGIVVAVKDELNVPLRYIGVGEGIEDLRPFSAEEFTEALFSTENTALAMSSSGTSKLAKVKRRRRSGSSENNEQATR